MMKNSMRKLSALMAFVMIFSLFAVIPATTVSAAEEAVTVSSIAIDAENTATGERAGSAAVEALIDGNKGNGAAWNASAFCRTGGGKNTVVILTLAEAATVSKVVVYGVADNASSAQGVTAVAVELSSDGTTWTAAEVALAGTATPTDASCYAGDVTATLATATEASYVRVTLTQFKYLGGFEEIEVMTEAEPEAGSPEAPITPDFFDIPGSFDTVEIEAGASLYYNLYRIGGTIITINDADASVTVDGETYDAVDGVVSFIAPASMSPMMPTTLVFSNKGTEAKSFTVNFSLPEGTMGNPEKLEELGWTDAVVAAGNTEGYYYTWTATEAGKVTLYISSATEGAEVDVVINNLNSYAQRSVSADGVEDEFGDKVVEIEVAAGDVLNIQAVVLPDADWNYPSTDTEISFVAAFEAPAGTESNPITPDYFDIPGSFDTDSIPAGSTVYYQLFGVADTILTIEDANVSVTVNGETYEAVDGVVTFVVPASMNPRMPVVLAITNNGSEDASFTVKFDLPEGAMGNPEDLEELGDITVNLEENDNDGYFFEWIAPADGILNATIIGATEGTEVDVTLSNGTTYAVKNGSDADENGVISIEVSEGDVITIQVVALPNENWYIPASDVEVSLEFVPNESEESSEDSSEDSSVDSSEDSSVDSSEESIEESSKVEGGTTDTGDAGLAVFALLAAISLAGVAVVKKVK